ncbi:MAG: transcriptional repressor [Clostridia bacterium]|nr:transcriptional repressor [Clostridia bacterium]MBQ9966756.1 transcriptional repressor [Clostridia bacterium]
MGLTKQKKAVLDAVMSPADHPTADEIYAIAKVTIPNIGLGTVYRNLNTLCSEGIIRKIEMPGGPDRFDKDISPHDHMVCSECGRVIDFQVDMGDLKDRIEERGFKVLSHNVQVVCICDRCLAKS